MSAPLALIAHDLKNGLGSLVAMLARLADEAAAAPHTGAEHAHHAAEAHAQGQELLQQFVQFLTLYGAQQGQLQALCEDEDPGALLQSLLTRWRGRLAREGRAVQVLAEPAVLPPAFWYFDRRLVTLALDAAMHNASRFARGHIWVGVQQAADGLQFTVRDDGPGLGQGETDAHLSTHLSTHMSTHLGQALAQAVAQAHVLQGVAGQAHLHNHPQGGAEFRLTLP